MVASASTAAGTASSGAGPSPRLDKGLAPFDEEFLRKLELLSLVSKRLLSGQFKAERRAKSVGSGVEFADYRGYVPGDDFRRVDWRAYLRFDRLIMHLFEEETDLPIYIFLDASGSMGHDGGAKLDYAKKVAAALAYVGLSNLDRVTLAAYSNRLIDELPVQRTKSQIFNVFRFLSGVQPTDTTDAAAAFNRYFSARKRRGMAVVISDFLDPNGTLESLDKLRYRRQDVLALHVVSPVDVEPLVNGEITLVDRETRSRRDLTATPALLKAYREEFDGFCDEIEHYCSLYGFGYVRTVTEFPFEDLILQIFRQGRFLN